MCKSYLASFLLALTLTPSSSLAYMKWAERYLGCYELIYKYPSDPMYQVTAFLSPLGTTMLPKDSTTEAAAYSEWKVPLAYPGRNGNQIGIWIIRRDKTGLPETNFLELKNDSRLSNLTPLLVTDHTNSSLFPSTNKKDQELLTWNFEISAESKKHPLYLRVAYDKGAFIGGSTAVDLLPLPVVSGEWKKASLVPITSDDAREGAVNVLKSRLKYWMNSKNRLNETNLRNDLQACQKKLESGSGPDSTDQDLIQMIKVTLEARNKSREQNARKEDFPREIQIKEDSTTGPKEPFGI